MRELLTPTTISIIAILIIALAFFIYDYINSKTESIYGRVIDKVYLPDWNTESFGYEQYILVIDIDDKEEVVKCSNWTYQNISINDILSVKYDIGKYTKFIYSINAESKA